MSKPKSIAVHQASDTGDFWGRIRAAVAAGQDYLTTLIALAEHAISTFAIKSVQLDAKGEVVKGPNGQPIEIAPNTGWCGFTRSAEIASALQRDYEAHKTAFENKDQDYVLDRLCNGLCSAAGAILAKRHGLKQDKSTGAVKFTIDSRSTPEQIVDVVFTNFSAKGAEFISRIESGLAAKRADMLATATASANLTPEGAGAQS